MSDLAPEAFAEIHMRSASEVARRCVVLYAVVAAGHKASRGDLVRWLQREGLWKGASPEEITLFQSRTPSRKQMAGATWRVEALFPLLWALNEIATLPPATSLCDVELVRSLLPPLLAATAGFLSKATLRSQSEILDAHEETYQAHWAASDAMLNGRQVPNGYNPEILQERHLALKWLIFPDQDWDDVTTDT